MSGQLFIPDLPGDRELASKVIDNASSIDKIKTERGFLGGIWGASSHIPHNIAALIIVLLVLSGMTYTLIKIDSSSDDKSLSIKDFWSIISPLITLSIGYLFGDKKKSESDK